MIRIPITAIEKEPINQLKKVREEFMEVVDAYQRETDERIVEECCDLIQATLNLIDLVVPGQIRDALEKHSRKMEDRKYEVSYYLSLKRQE